MDYQRQLRAAERHLAKNDPKLARLIKRFGPCGLRPHDDFYGELVSSIVGQQLSTKAAATIWRRVMMLFDESMPTPEQLMQADEEKLREAGVSRPKIGYMKDLASHVLDRRLDLEHIATMPNQQLIEQLTAVKGIGEWSAHMFMMFSLGRMDVLPVGDLGIRKAMMACYGLSRLPDPAACITVANDNRWHPYEAIACWYLWKSLDSAPQPTRHDN